MMEEGNSEDVGPAVASHERRGWMQRGGKTPEAQGGGLLGWDARRAARQETCGT